MREGRVGIVIPAFNAGRYVAEAAESAAAGLGAKDDVVIVDDGSSDKLSLDVLAGLRESGFRVIRQDNQGVSAARNAGLRLLSTPYAFVLDSDDLITPIAATVAADILDRDETAAIVAGSGVEFSNQGGCSVPLSPGRPTRESMRQGTWIATASAFRVADWRRVGGFPEGVAIGEDWVFWMRLLRDGGRVAVVEDVVVHRRLHARQVTRGYIDPREGVKAKNLVTMENQDMVLKYPEEIIEELVKLRTRDADYRYSRRALEVWKSRLGWLWKPLRLLRNLSR